MEPIKSLLRADPSEWLLEGENPSVRYFALRELNGRPESDPLVQETRDRIMDTGLVPAMLAKQREPEYLRAYPRFYTAKYEGLVWSLIVLAELGARPVPQVREQCEYILSASQEDQDGGFAMHTAARTGGGRITEVIPCLTGNMVWSLIRLGYLDDPRLQKGIGWLVRFMRYNDGEETDPQLPPYSRYDMCWGKHTCHMGAVKALKAFSAIPAEKRTAEMDGAIRKAAEFLLSHHILKRSHDLRRVSKPGWLKFGFPLMYQTDALEIFDLLAGLGYRDKRMEEAAELILFKQDGAGRWKLENNYAGSRLLIPMGREGEPDKWITLRAVRALKAYAGGD